MEFSSLCLFFFWSSCGKKGWKFFAAVPWFAHTRMERIALFCVYALTALCLVWVWSQVTKEPLPPPPKVVAEPAPPEVPSFVAAPFTPPPVRIVATPPPKPVIWYTTRRIAHMTDSGIFAIPAGKVVERRDHPGGTSIFYDGREIPADPSDLTTKKPDFDVAEAPPSRISPSSPPSVAPDLPPGGVAVPIPGAGLPELPQLPPPAAAAPAVRDQARINAAIAAVDAQIETLRSKITFLQRAHSAAVLNGRVSGHPAVITKCEKEIALLLVQKARLQGM